jgi:hypothetical protein
MLCLCILTDCSVHQSALHSIVVEACFLTAQIYAIGANGIRDVESVIFVAQQIMHGYTIRYIYFSKMSRSSIRRSRISRSKTEDEMKFGSLERLIYYQNKQTARAIDT